MLFSQILLNELVAAGLCALVAWILMVGKQFLAVYTGDVPSRPVPVLDCERVLHPARSGVCDRFMCHVSISIRRGSGARAPLLCLVSPAGLLRCAALQPCARGPCLISDPHRCL